MQINFRKSIYWILGGVAFFALIAVLYPMATYESLNMEVTRTDAIRIAKEYLEKQNIKLDGFYKEAFIDNSPVEIKYILKKLGREGFKEYSKNKKWANLCWNVLFHLNLPKQIQQTEYSVDVSNKGEVFGFRRNLPDSLPMNSLSKEEATELIMTFLDQQIGDEFDDYTLVSSNEVSYYKRTDYNFRWEKTETNPAGKIVISGRVQGNSIGGYSHYFEVPQYDRQYIDAGDAIYGTVSIIFVGILMMYAFSIFLAKYHQGEVWMSVGKVLFIIFFLIGIFDLVNSWPAIGRDLTIGSISFIYTKIIMFLINGLLIIFFLGLLVFAGWTVGESYARGLWPKKLVGVDAFVKGHLLALDSGISLMRGLVFGAALAATYLLGDIILNTPGSKIFISPAGNFAQFGNYLPAFSIIADAFTMAILSSIAITFFVVNISYQRWKKKWLSITLAGLATVLVFIIATTPPSLNNLGINLISNFVFGCFIAYIYFLFDLLTITSLHFNAAIITKGYALYASHNNFYELNLLILLIVVLVTPAIFIMSIFRKEHFVLKNYGLPSHVKKISERERLRKEMEIAAKVQLSLLPKEEPKIPGYDIASISIPAVEAGGDYFDFVKLNGDKLGIAIGDVSGKGVGAAIYMTLTKGILQAHAEENTSPKNVLAKVNRLLYKTIEKNSFVSMFYAILNINNHILIYSRAGHNPCILCSPETGQTKLLMSKGMALGLEEGSKFISTLSEESIQMNKGDVVVFYTDGFTEAMNEKQEQYGEANLIRLIELNRDKSSREIINIILKDVKRFVDNYPQHDDMTIVVLKRC